MPVNAHLRDEVARKEYAAAFRNAGVRKPPAKCCFGQAELVSSPAFFSDVETNISEMLGRGDKIDADMPIPETVQHHVVYQLLLHARSFPAVGTH